MSSSLTFQPGKVTGSCACRRITFETTVLPKNISSCYCRECAKQSGGGYLPFAHFPTSAITWSVQPDIWQSSKWAQRGFCKECASTVSFRDSIDADEISIAMAMIDSSSEPLPKMEAHIFLKEKAAWVMVPDDGAGRFEKHNPAFQQRLDTWKKQ